VQQAEVLGDVEIEQASEEHRKTYVGASLHLSEEAEKNVESKVLDDVNTEK